MIFLIGAFSGLAFGGGFARLPVSARAVSLGGSLLSLADDPNVVFFNPAGIAPLKSLSLSSSYTRLFPGIADDQLGYVSGSAVANLGLVGNLGVGIRSFQSNFWKENELIGSYAQQMFEFLSVGGSVKLLQWSTPSPSGRFAVPEPGMSKVALSFDVGVQSQISNIVPDNDVRFGIFLGDLTQPSLASNGAREGKLDRRLSAGAAYISRTYNYLVTVHYTVAGDVKRIGLGTEISAMRASILGESIELVVRVGGGGAGGSAKQGDVNGGLGFLVAGFILDYAYTHQTELRYVDGSHHLSLRYTF